MKQAPHPFVELGACRDLVTAGHLADVQPAAMVVIASQGIQSRRKVLLRLVGEQLEQHLRRQRLRRGKHERFDDGLQLILIEPRLEAALVRRGLVSGAVRSVIVRYKRPALDLLDVRLFVRWFIDLFARHDSLPSAGSRSASASARVRSSAGFGETSPTRPSGREGGPSTRALAIRCARYSSSGSWIGCGASCGRARL